MARHQTLRQLLLSTAALLLLATAADAYTVFLKDGGSIVAARPYEIEGEYALIETPSGATTRVPLEQVDVARTREYNQRDYGNALVIEGRSGPDLESADPRTLDELLQQRRLAPPEEEAGRRLPKTSAGYVDLTALRRQPLDAGVADGLRSALRAEGLSEFGLHRGSSDARVLVELITNDQDAVFEGLVALSRAFERLGPGVEVLEVLMITNRRARAGQFAIDAENAPLLAQRRVSPADFFVTYVQF